MTICIAALAENGKKAVIAADQMITASIPVQYEFETDDVQKIYRFDNHNRVLTAGNALYAYEIVENARKLVNEESPIEVIAEALRKTYSDYRLQLLTRKYLEPIGLTLADYYRNQQTLFQPIVGDIHAKLTNEPLDVNLIVVGQDSDRKFRIFTISNPGQLDEHSPIGYACVGSGGPHAMYWFVGSEYKKSLTAAKVKDIVKEAKKRAEVAPGVGKATTVEVLGEERVASTNG